jgi:hypothetical protein
MPSDRPKTLGPDVSDYPGMTVSGAKWSFVVWDELATEGLPWPADATHLQHDELKLLILFS